MGITEQQLVQILPNSRKVAAVFVPALNAAMNRYGIDQNARRMAEFIAQCGHESAQLTVLVENLNYSAQGLANTWPSRYAVAPAASPRTPNELAVKLARRPEAIANNAYANRNGNGPEATGDGWKYRGRGLLQVTGRANYVAAGAALALDLAQRPELLELPWNACMSAAHFWSKNGLNDLADDGNTLAITKRINGGTKGLDERQALAARGRVVLA
jgi:putative chitinase